LLDEKVIILLLFQESSMLTTMRQIGNSRGVLIPAAFLASCQIEDQVDMQLQDGQIVIKPVRRKLRNAWFVDAAAHSEAVLAQEKVEAQEWSEAPVADDSEWVW
jgi:antitoxin MazE